jgi:uncharacterized membrane protein
MADDRNDADNTSHLSSSSKRSFKRRYFGMTAAWLLLGLVLTIVAGLLVLGAFSMRTNLTVNFIAETTLDKS